MPRRAERASERGELGRSGGGGDGRIGGSRRYRRRSSRNNAAGKAWNCTPACRSIRHGSRHGRRPRGRSPRRRHRNPLPLTGCPRRSRPGERAEEIGGEILVNRRVGFRAAARRFAVAFRGEKSGEGPLQRREIGIGLPEEHRAESAAETLRHDERDRRPRRQQLDLARQRGRVQVLPAPEIVKRAGRSSPRPSSRARQNRSVPGAALAREAGKGPVDRGQAAPGHPALRRAPARGSGPSRPRSSFGSRMSRAR